LADYPDVCSVQEVIWICGYSKETVFKWCAKEKFTCFNINRKYHIPKKSFIDFMATAEFTTIVQKQRKHLELLSKFEQWEEQCP
jgi:hypothetical protein